MLRKICIFSERALVFGNDLFDPKLNKPLTCCVQDAKAVAKELEARGFTVSLSLNATGQEMTRESFNFGHSRAPGDLAVVYFAGHGSEVRAGLATQLFSHTLTHLLFYCRRIRRTVC
jgi:hypothetical protein